MHCLHGLVVADLTGDCIAGVSTTISILASQQVLSDWDRVLAPLQQPRGWREWNHLCQQMGSAPGSA